MIRRSLRFLLPALPVLAAALVAASFWMGSPSPVSAHALLVSSDPPVNARLEVPPPEVAGVFSEGLDQRLSSLQVLDGTGERVDSGETEFGPENTRMSTAIPEELPPGFYTVVWETLSTVDGHLFKGSFPFVVLNQDGSEPEGPIFTADLGSGYGPQPDNVFVKWLSLAASIMLVGGLAFAVWVVRPASTESDEPWQQRAREAGRRNLLRVAWPAIGVLVLVAAGELLVQARQLGGFQFIDDVLRGTWGERWIQRQLVLAGVAGALYLSQSAWRNGRSRLSEFGLWVALGGGLAYLLLIAMVSHAGANPGSFWAIGVDFIHLATAAVWIGMLSQLMLFFFWSREAPEDERVVLQAAHLQRFSVIAASSVIVLLASGVTNALGHISTAASLADTAYGRSLVVKLGIVGMLLAVAAVNAAYLRPRIVDEWEGLPRLRSRLSTLMRVELGLALAVLLVTAAMMQYPTSRQVVVSEENLQTVTEAVVGFEELQEAGDIRVNVSISPNAVGTNSYRVFLFPDAGTAPEDILRVRLRFRPPDPELGPSEIIAEEVSAFAYSAVGAFFQEPGSWEVHADIRRRDLEDVTTVFRVNVAGPAGVETGGRFDYPLTAGSWAAVGATGALVLALLMGVWGSQWPGLPRAAPRLLRVGSASITVLGVAGLALAILPDGDTAAGNPIDSTPQSIAIGSSLYFDNCAVCHGDTGRGDGPAADALDVPPSDFRRHIPFHTDEFFFFVIENGLGDIMPAFGERLSDDDTWHLINYLKAEYGIEAQQADDLAGE